MIRRYSFIAGIFTAIFLIASNHTNAQLQVYNTMTPTQLVQNVLIGTGVTAFNVTYTGATNAHGNFLNGNTTNLGLNEGVILSSGPSTAIPGPVGNFQSVTLGTSGDVDLDALTSSSSYDAAVLQFDFIPLSNTVNFRYVFGSEEYPEFVCSSFNDVFGFFLSGPGITGPYSNNSKNIALIPGTSLPVAINTVNNGNPGGSYSSSGCTSLSYSAYFVDNQALGGTTICYDGFTTVLTATSTVIPCSTYHIKLAIGDVSDGIYDSGVFLEANSFSTNAVTFEQTSTLVTDTTAIEGCSEVIISFETPNLATSNIPINYWVIGGTAIQNTDYTVSPSNVFIATGTDSTVLYVQPLVDGITEGPESVIIVVQTTPCTTDTFTVWITDGNSMTMNLPSDTTICLGQSLTITPNVSGGAAPYSYAWGGGETTPTLPVTPTSIGTTTYQLMVSDGCGSSQYDELILTVGSGVAYAGPDTTICSGGTAILTANSGATGYLWSNSATTQSISVSPVTSTWYTVTVNTGCMGKDSVYVTVNPNPTITVNSPTVCAGTPAVLTAGGANTYSWSDGLGTGNPVTVTPATTTIYSVTGTDAIGCTNFTTSTVTVNPVPTSNFNLPPQICIGSNVPVTYLGSATAGATYTWTFGGGTIVSGSGQGPYSINWSSPGNNSVTLSVTENGCTSTLTSNSIQVLPIPIAGFDLSYEICSPTFLTLTNLTTQTSSNVSYAWAFGDGATSTMEDPTHNYSDSGNYVITLIVSNNGLCIDTVTSFIHVNQIEQIVLNASMDTTFCTQFHDFATLHAWATGGYGDLTYTWNPTSMTATDTIMVSPMFTTTYTVTVADSCGNFKNENIVVNIVCPILIPNVFTPNGDGSNDNFVVENLEFYPNSRIEIFNRWGRKVYQNDNYQNDWNGGDCADGTYYYILFMPNGTSYSGFLTILR